MSVSVKILPPTVKKSHTSLQFIQSLLVAIQPLQWRGILPGKSQHLITHRNMWCLLALHHPGNHAEASRLTHVIVFIKGLDERSLLLEEQITCQKDWWVIHWITGFMCNFSITFAHHTLTKSNILGFTDNAWGYLIYEQVTSLITFYTSEPLKNIGYIKNKKNYSKT